MIEWFTVVTVAAAAVVGVYGVLRGIRGHAPGDVALLGTALIELLLIVQIVVAIVAPFAGNEPTGDLLEFWLYLVTAALIPPLAALWALVERSRWSSVALGVAALAIAVMVYRMQQIWSVQVA